MARLIYALKIYIFRDAGFKLTNQEIRRLGDFCVFGVTAYRYIKSWFLSHLPTAAPANDLQLLKLLALSASPASLSALKKLCGQLWYLSEELVAFAFFGHNVDAVQKRAIVEALSSQGTKDIYQSASLLISLRSSTNSFMTLLHTIQRTSSMFCPFLTLFLSEDPQTWSTNEAYLDAEVIVRELRVVNDTAERGVALMQRRKTKNKCSLPCK